MGGEIFVFIVEVLVFRKEVMIEIGRLGGVWGDEIKGYGENRIGMWYYRCFLSKEAG